MQRRLARIIYCLLLAACAKTPSTGIPGAVPPAASQLPPAETENPVRLPAPYTGDLKLIAADAPAGLCEQTKSPLTLPSAGVIPLGFLPSRKCDEIHSGLDLFETGDRLFVAQRSARGFRLVDATDPARPAEIGLWELKPRGGRGHITAFRQFDRRYLALPLETPSPYSTMPNAFPCGVLIIEVTQPEAPVLQGRYDGPTTGSSIAWCNVHSIEISADADGNAAFLFISTPNTADLRVLDIRNLNAVRDVNAFHRHIHPHGDSGSWAHRAAVLGDRVYISYWGGGVMIVDRSGLETGASSDAILLAPPDGIDPAGFIAHDSQPAAGGNYLFVNDMERVSDGIRLFDIRDLSRPREIWASDFTDTETGHHSLQVWGDLLFVPWFREGLRVFHFDLKDLDRPVIEQIAFQPVREPPYNPTDGGITELKVHLCQIGSAAHTCIYATDEELGLVILALE
jgi:hypothetical protein